MAVFFNNEYRMHAFVSFKATYSRFATEPAWEFVAIEPTLKMLCRAIVNGTYSKSVLVVRSPYDRTISGFMDKYRKQPQRISEPGFNWQHCHRLLYPYLGIGKNDSDKEIAERFLQFSFDEFINLLPRIYSQNGHFHPQAWTSQVLFSKTKFGLNWPNVKRIRLEDPEELKQIPGIEFGTKSNSTSHLQRDFALSAQHKSTIRSIYKDDFKLGGYTP